jgi:DNA polymerase-3 subunit delta
MQYYRELMNELRLKNIAPVYFFFGAEAYLREQAVQKFRQDLVPPEIAAFNIDVLDGEETSEEVVVSCARTPPVMVERRLVIVQRARFFSALTKKNTAEKDNEKDNDSKVENKKEVRLNYLQKPLPSTCLVFNTDQGVDQRRNLFKAVKKNGRVIEFASLKRQDLHKWLAKETQRAGKKIAPATIEMLLNRVGQNMFLLKSEIQKLITFTGDEKVIEASDVQILTEPLIEESIFKVVDAIGQRLISQALKGIKDLLVSRQPPPVILAMLARQFRLILQTRQLVSSGRSQTELVKLLNIHPYVVNKIINQSKNFNEQQIIVILNRLLEIDLGTKTGKLEFYPAMETLLLELRK